MAQSLRKQVINLLVDSHGIDRGKLETILKTPKARAKGLGTVLVEEGLITQAELMNVLARGLAIPPMNLSRYRPDPSLADIVPEQTARQYRLVPVSKIGSRLSVAMADPLNILALDDLAMLTSLEISPILASEQDVEGAIRQLYQHPSEPLDALLEDAEGGQVREEEAAEEVVDLSALGLAGKKAPIVKVVDMMIAESLRARASDIHVEPYEGEVRVRYRIDGVLQEAFRLPKRHQNPFLTRLKILSNMDITESRLPQDGRFKVRCEGKEIDFRVSALPVSSGNKIVMRALDKSNLSVNLDQLGFLPSSLKAFKAAISRPYGLILVTGPTGSGKSTTLYSVLNQMNEPGRNILTVEDPVEYQVDGITQVQVNPDIGLTFASVLRTFLRQAPDVVLVGEIRDGETADIAIKASLTGQIVLATLHTNDAPSAVTRLVDMGVDPFLLSSSLVFVAAQRLCRQICPRCKTVDSLSENKLKQLDVKLPKDVKLFRGKGCAACRETGFRGRFGILEAMLVDDAIREKIILKRSPDEIKAHAVSKGMKVLRDEGLEHCLSGQTTLAEVLKVTSEE